MQVSDAPCLCPFRTAEQKATPARSCPGSLTVGHNRWGLFSKLRSSFSGVPSYEAIEPESNERV